MANILTVDLEDWYHTNGLNIPRQRWEQYESRIEASTGKLLEILDEYEVKATFFVLGCVAKRNPELIQDIHSRGHEIGSHGGWHQLVSNMSMEEFREDLRFSKNAIEEITGVSVKFYRAPSWSIAAHQYEALEILEDEGFLCDTSFQPFRTPLSGNAGSPTYPFRPVIRGKALNLVEFPSTVLEWGGIKLPFSGGFYLRFWPSWVSLHAMRLVTRGRPGMVYVHPWEMDSAMPRLKLPLHIRLIQYYKVGSMETKLRAMLKQFSFTTLGQYLNTQPDIPLVHLDYAYNKEGIR